MTDALDRLRAANPVTDLNEVERGVRPLRPPVPARRRSRLFSAPRLILAAGVLLVASVVTLVGLPGRAGRPNPVGRIDLALAAAKALDPGKSILHVVTRTTQRGPDVTDGVARSDIWLAPGGKTERVRTVRGDGTVLEDSRPRFAGPTPRNADPVSVARAMLRDGNLRPAGRVLSGGRLLERFRNQTGEATWYFDARTLIPVRTVLHPRPRHGRFVAVTDFLRYERLTDTAANRRLLVPSQRVDPRPPGG